MFFQQLLWNVESCWERLLQLNHLLAMFQLLWGTGPTSPSQSILHSVFDCLLCCLFVCICLADSCLHIFDLAFITFSLLLRIFGNILTECFVFCHRTFFIAVDYFSTCCGVLTKFTCSDISIKLMKSIE